VSVLLAVLAGLARGGKWAGFKTFRFKKPWLVVVAVSLQLIIFNPVWGKYMAAGRVTNLFYISSVLILFAFILININVYGLSVLGLGILSNSVAIIANGGNMPSSPEALKNILPAESISQLYSGTAYNNIVMITESTRFKFLCDIFYVPNINVYSIGDMAIAVGAFITVQQIMLHRGGINDSNQILSKGG
jgi:hypothetical protein